MPNSGIANLIASNITQSSGLDRITASEVRAVLNAMNSYICDSVAYSPSIPFTRMNSAMNPHPVTGAINFTPNTSGAEKWASTGLRLTANGTHTPTFSDDFKKANTSKDYVNINGTVNVLIFWFDGVTYWYSIYQEAGVIPPPAATPPEVLGMIATAAKIIQVSFDQSVTISTAGWSFKRNGVNNPVVSVVNTAPATYEFTLTNDMAAGETILGSYSSGAGDTIDSGGDELESFFDGAVTNSVPGAAVTVEDTTFDALNGWTPGSPGGGFEAGIQNLSGTNKLVTYSPTGGGYANAGKPIAFDFGDILRITLFSVDSIPDGGNPRVAANLGGWHEDVPAQTNGTFVIDNVDTSPWSDKQFFVMGAPSGSSGRMNIRRILIEKIG